MNREEILSKSQAENQGKDLVSIEAAKQGYKIAWAIVNVLAIIVVIVDGIVFGRFVLEILFPIYSGIAVFYYFKFSKAHQRGDLVTAILNSAISLSWFAYWIINIIRH